jgi:hypothetical protein
MLKFQTATAVTIEAEEEPMTLDQGRAYIEMSRLHQRRKRVALLTILSSSFVLWAGLIAVGWGVWSHLP